MAPKLLFVKVKRNKTSNFKKKNGAFTLEQVRMPTWVVITLPQNHPRKNPIRPDIWLNYSTIGYGWYCLGNESAAVHCCLVERQIKMSAALYIRQWFISERCSTRTRTLQMTSFFFYIFFCFLFAFILPHFQAEKAETEILQHVRSEPLWRSNNCTDFVTRLGTLAPLENLYRAGQRMTGLQGAFRAFPSAFLNLS